MYCLRDNINEFDLQLFLSNLCSIIWYFGRLILQQRTKYTKIYFQFLFSIILYTIYFCSKKFKYFGAGKKRESSVLTSGSFASGY